MVMITMFDADLLLTLMCKLLSSVYLAFFYTERSPKERSQIGPVNSLYQSAVLGPFSFEGGTVTDQRSWRCWPIGLFPTSCWGRWLPFPARWCPVALKSRRQISQCWTSGVVQAAREVTGSNFVTSFFRGMRGPQFAYRRFLQLWRNWKFLKQFAWRLRIHFRASGPN